MKKLLLLVLSLTYVNSLAQDIVHHQEDYVLLAVKSSERLTIDGLDNEPIWQRAQPIGDFWLKFPTADKKTTTKTTVKAAYDDEFLYFFITAYDSTNKYTAPSLKRDVSIQLADGVVIALDPVNKRTNGFGFSVTPNNVQSEYQYSNGFDDISFAWDNKWFSEAIRYDDKYVIEIAIPFKTLRYDASNTTWGINFVRSNKKTNEFYTWTNVPVQFKGVDLGYLGTLQFEGNLTSQKGNVSLIPYIRGSASSDAENNEKSGLKPAVGFDAKIAVSPSLNLDLTVNPDFSNVDVDVQVTNLTRFSILFPERRTFFLENDDIFGAYGAPPARPFFSRAIGLDRNAQPIPILFGARLSGNVTDRTRIGVMNMQTGAKGDFASQNYSAVSVIQSFGPRSNVKGYFLNRQAVYSDSEIPANPLEKYGRNYGGELNLVDKNGINTLWAGFHNSVKKAITDETAFYQLGGGHFGENLTTFIDAGLFGRNYYADMGFINRLESYAQSGPTYDFADTTFRNGFFQVYNENNYTFRPKDKKLVQFSLGLSNYAVWFRDGNLSDKMHMLSSSFSFENTATIDVGFSLNQDNLRYYFPLPENKPLAPGTYNYNNLSVNLATDNRKNAVFEGGFMVGDFYNGQIRQYSGSLLLRAQPYFNATLSAQYNDLIFPDEYGRTKLWLVGPKLEATFTNKLFWTTFLQFNTQQNNFNINSRVQYRYSPMSDFFVVYTDNYFSNPLFENKNRAIVFKLNYWLTM